MGYVTRPDRMFSICIGGGRFYATGSSRDGTHKRRLDLSHLVGTLPTAALMRIADRWGVAHGYIQRYRRPASFRRFCRRLRRHGCTHPDANQYGRCARCGWKLGEEGAE